MTQILMFSGQELRDAGINLALENANKQTDNWSELAYDFLMDYIRLYDEFMTEDVRLASEKYIPEPPSKRAWGGIIVRAVKAGMITRVDYSPVKNPKAHCTPATIWKSKI